MLWMLVPDADGRGAYPAVEDVVVSLEMVRGLVVCVVEVARGREGARVRERSGEVGELGGRGGGGGGGGVSVSLEGHGRRDGATVSADCLHRASPRHTLQTPQRRPRVSSALPECIAHKSYKSSIK